MMFSWIVYGKFLLVVNGISFIITINLKVIPHTCIYLYHKYRPMNSFSVLFHSPLSPSKKITAALSPFQAENCGVSLTQMTLSAGASETPIASRPRHPSAAIS